MIFLKLTYKGDPVSSPSLFALCGRPLDTVCDSWLESEVDKREGGVNKEWGFGRFSIDLHPHQFLKGHQQYSIDNKIS